MKKLLYLLVVITLLSCNSKPTRIDYLKKALESDTYKNAFENVKRVNAGLDSVKKGKLDPRIVIFIYNNSIATQAEQAIKISQVEEGMKKKDTAYLKTVQLKVADDLALADEKAGKY
jgi:hypothetical protein